MLRTDASDCAIGAVLEQANRPVGFLSKKLAPAETRYATYDKKLLAMVRALEKWRHYIASFKW